MKIALVRGAFLSPFELQLYFLLTERHTLTAIGADWRLYPYAIDFPSGQIREAKMWGSGSRILYSRAPILVNRTLSWTLGQSYGLYDLHRIVGRPDILHSAESFFTMTYQCLQIKRRTGCRLVVTVSENIAGSGETHPVRRRRKEAVLQEVDMFVAITETTRNMLREEGVAEDRITIIPNSVNTQRFTPQPKDPELLKRLALKGDETVILFIGRFVREKGLEEILSAVPGVLSSHLNLPIRFCFVGEGPLGNLLRRAQRAWPETIRIHPFVSYDEIPAFHRLADIFVMPSKPGHKINEQFGYVLAESMATAKPVITTRCGSIPDVVGEAAVMIPPADTGSLERAIIDLLDSPPKRTQLGEKARERIKIHFDAEKNAHQLELLYERLIHTS
jgi:starch synthase